MPDTNFTYKTVSGLSGGLDTSSPGDELADEFSPNLRNVFIDKGVLKSDSGYIEFGDPVEGYPQLAVQLFYKDGTNDLILVTTERCYKWNNAEWQFVAGSVSTALASDATGTGGSVFWDTGGSTFTDTGGSTFTDTANYDIEVADATGFNVGDYIVITLDNGGQHYTQIAAIDGITITLQEPLPSSASAGNAVSVPAVLDGNLTNQVNFAQWTAGDKLIITNNRDNIKQFDGSSLTDLSNLPSGGNCQAGNVAVYNNYLLLINTTEGGTAYPQRVRWCDTGDITDWTNGNASYEDLWDDEDFLLLGIALGPYIYLYRERSIYRGAYIGSSERIFDFERMVSGEGAISSQAVADVGDYHIFWGNANVYRYEGDFSIEPIADRIYYEIFGTDGIANPEYSERTFGLYVEELDEIWFFFVATGSETPNRLLRYSIVSGGLFLREFAHSMLGYGFYLTTNAKTWNTLTGTWLQQNWSWNSKRITSSSPVTLLGGYNPKQVYSYNYTAQKDDETDIAWYYDTKDFTSPSEKLRFDLLEFEAKGGTTRVLYSLDAGRTYKQLVSKVMGASYTKHRIWSQFVTDQVRFRFEGDATGFALKRLKMKFREESFW
jgi:hypothetical protein